MVLDSRQDDIRVLLISPMRIYREGLAHVLEQEPGIRVVGMAAGVEGVGSVLEEAAVDVALTDVSAALDLAGMRPLFQMAQRPAIVALGVVEHEEQVIAWAEAGIAGYVTSGDSVAHLVHAIRDAARGDFSCPPHISGWLLRRLGTVGRQAGVPGAPAGLTLREQEVVRLIALGLSNKEIARRLQIQLATVKHHVHNILDKVGVSRRADVVATLRPGRGA